MHSWPFRLLPVIICLLSTLLAAEDEEEDFRFRFRFPQQMVVRSGEPPTNDADAHGDQELSEAEFAKRVEDVTQYWKKRKGGEITKQDVVELYHRAQDFKVVHAILNEVITGPESQKIGQLRQEIHDEVLRAMAESGEFGKKMGVNDFGSGAKPGSVNAKTDIDFTTYAGRGDITGAQMVARYRELFRQITAKYGKVVDPGQMDIVAHQFEATIPDWRQNMAVSDFEAKLKQGLDLLRSNPEAYFLEGAFLQQVMRRSVDPNAKTFAWFEPGPDNRLQKKFYNAAKVPQFFYFPEIRQRYAWGAAVGNWHFFHAHSDDLAAQAKYILRSIDDGAGMLLGRIKTGDMDKLTPSERRRIVKQLYGGQFSEVNLRAFEALVETAVNIRKLKSQDNLRVSSLQGEVDAYRPLIELERAAAGGVELSDETLLKLAKDRFNKAGNQLLIQNNILTSRGRLTDWLSPDLKVGKDLDLIDSEGRWRKIRIDESTIKRLQYSAYFELKAALSLMTDAQISRIQDANPKFRNDIEIIRKVLKSERQMLSTPSNLAGNEVMTYRQHLADQALKDYGRLKQSFQQKGLAPGMFDTGKVMLGRAQELETWFQTKAVDKLLMSERGKNYLPHLYKLREGVNEANQHLLGPKWMMRMDKGLSIIEILKTYIREGEVNAEVGKRAFIEGVSFLPFMGVLFSVQGGVEGVTTLALVQVIPGYGQLLLTSNVIKGLVEIGGLMIFEPLKRDKVLLAYQGYLDPQEDSWWWPFASDVKERVVSPRPHLLLPVDRDMTLSLEERREKMYHFLHDRVMAHLRHDYGIPSGEPISPELAQKEYEYLNKHLGDYVDNWWNGTGPIFGEYDVLTVHRAQDIRPELFRMLQKDYMTGKNRDLQKQMMEREEKMEQLQGTYDEVAAESIAIDEAGKTLRGEHGSYAEAGNLFLSHVLETMPEIKPSIEILAAPHVVESDDGTFDHMIDRMNFRAKVVASQKEYPGPWKIEWKVDKPQAPGVADSSASMDLPHPQTEVEAAGAGTITITAIAHDAEGQEIIRGSIQVEVEKEKVKKEEEDELDPSKPGPDEEAGNDLIDQMEKLVSKAAAESGKVDEECKEGGLTAEETSKASEKLGKDLETLTETSESIRDKIAELTSDFAEINALKQTIDDAADELANLRDEMRKLSISVCVSAVDVRKATSEEARERSMKDAREKMKQLRELHAKAKKRYVKITEAMAKLRAIEEKRQALMSAIDQFDERMNQTERSKVDVRLKESESKASHTEAETFVGKLEETEGAGEEILQQGEEIDDPVLHEVLESLFGQISASKSKVENCPAPLGEELGKIGDQLSKIEGGINDLDEQMDDALRNIDFNVALARLSIALEDGEATLAVIDLFMESIDQRLLDGQKCLDSAEQTLLNPITVIVPPVKELPIKEAREVLKKAGLKAKFVPGSIAVTEAQSLTVEHQKPKAGSRVKPESQVVVKIFSKFKGELSVPELRGRTEDEARQLVSGKFTLSVGKGDSAPSKQLEGKVQSQNPDPYKELKKGETVTVKLYTLYKPARVVPDVIGLYTYEADDIVRMAGFEFVKVAGETAPNKLNEGVIYRQSPISGKSAGEGVNAITVTYYKKIKEQPAVPPQETPVRTQSASGFYVAFSLYFPKIPTDIPDLEQPKDYLKNYLKRLPVKESSFVVNKDHKIFFFFHDEAIGTFKSGQFTPGSKFASPFNIDFTNDKGESFKLKGAFLMEVDGTFETFRDLAQAYPAAKHGGVKAAVSEEPSLFYVDIDNSDGMYSSSFDEKQAAGKIKGGPIYEGWPHAQMKQNIDFVIFIVEIFDCFIATAVYQTVDNDQLATLRTFRDEVLAKSEAGRHLINFYYNYGPGWAAWVYNKPAAVTVIRTVLDCVVWVLDKVDMKDPKTAKTFQPMVNFADWMFIEEEEKEKSDED